MSSRYVKHAFKEAQQEQYRHTPSNYKEDITRHGDQKQSSAVVTQEQQHQHRSQPNAMPNHLPLEAFNGKDAGHASATRECTTYRSSTVIGIIKASAVLQDHWHPTNNNLLPLQHNGHHQDRHQNYGQNGSLVRVRDGDTNSHDEPEQARRIILYKQRSTKSLLADDDDEEASVRDRFLQGIPVPPHKNRNDDKFANVINTHPDLQSVLEVFPDANPGRVLHLLRQKSLTATLLLLADESSDTTDTNISTTCPPSDELLLPPDVECRRRRAMDRRWMDEDRIKDERNAT